MRASAIMLMAAFLMSTAAPVFAATSQESETCAIFALSRQVLAEIAQKRVAKLKKEIKAGKTYNMEEMKALEQKLQDAMDQLDKVEGKK